MIAGDAFACVCDYGSVPVNVSRAHRARVPETVEVIGENSMTNMQFWLWSFAPGSCGVFREVFRESNNIFGG